MDARSEILSRVAVAKVAPTTAERPAVLDSIRDRSSVIEQFAEYVAEYKANVSRCATSDLQAEIQRLLAGETVLVAADFPEEWRPASSNVDVALSVHDLDQPSAVLTLCAVGIAETGTIVLDAGVGQGRRAITLVPDHHVLIVPEDRIVDSVPEAVALLAEAVRLGRPLTWISGPSATSDIELSRVEGVHGPRRLDVVIAER